MNAFDKIAGYAALKDELERVAFALREPERCRALGVKPPRGLLLWGKPGVGKTLMARCLIEAAGREVFVCRKDKPDGEFLTELRGVFERAKESAPSVVLLDDMDKFSNGERDRRNEEEYVAIQTCIDGLGEAEVFVLATANDIGNLPDSLLRPGRLDRVIEVEAPRGKDAEAVAERYLREKSRVSDVDAEAVAQLMDGRSCADLEAAVNEAGLLAAWEGAEQITGEHLLRACLWVAYGIPAAALLPDRPDDPENPKRLMTRAACHEAGHALISELLCPGSVSVACIHERVGRSCGFVAYRRPEEDGTFPPDLLAALRALGGRAALDQRFGLIDPGASDDLQAARELLHARIAEQGCRGFDLLDAAVPEWEGQAERQAERQHIAVSAELERCCAYVKRLVAENRRFLDALTRALLKKSVLTGAEVRALARATGAQPCGAMNTEYRIMNSE